MVSLLSGAPVTLRTAVSGPPLRIGVISDTHGLLRPEALDRLRDVDHILHAGDIGKPSVIDGLVALAPVTAIRGNIDRDAKVRHYPPTVTVQFGGLRVHLIHDVGDLRDEPDAEVVVSGHSHRPRVELRNGVLYLNPGAAGPRRFRLPVTVATLDLANGRVTPHIWPLVDAET